MGIVKIQGGFLEVLLNDMNKGIHSGIVFEINGDWSFPRLKQFVLSADGLS